MDGAPDTIISTRPAEVEMMGMTHRMDSLFLPKLYTAHVFCLLENSGMLSFYGV